MSEPRFNIIKMGKFNDVIYICERRRVLTLFSLYRVKTYIQTKERNRKLVIMFAGWGTDENSFIPLCNDDFDFILLHNYSIDAPLIIPEPKVYDRIILIGWSLGVWAAEYILPKLGIKPDIAIAVNGTPTPIDEKYGFSHAVFDNMFANLSSKYMRDFFFRMFGDRATFNANCNRLPKRTLESYEEEIRWLYNRIMEQTPPSIKWDYALYSTHNKVFPTKRMRNYWSLHKETKVIELTSLPHYIFFQWNSYSDFIQFVEAHS